jgi:hypothetical protein
MMRMRDLDQVWMGRKTRARANFLSRSTTVRSARRERRRIATWIALQACLVTGCAPPQARPSYHILVHVVSDPGQPLADAVLRRAGRDIARSDATGSIAVTLPGKAGDVITLDLLCPEGYRTPNTPLNVMLRELQNRERLPEFSMACPPLTRNVVIAVRATQGANLPLRYLGQELARTDDNGVAHALLRAKPGDTLTLTLDTSSAPQLMPRDPELKLNVPERDELYVFDQAFTRPKPKLKPKPPAPKPPEPDVPRRI